MWTSVVAEREAATGCTCSVRCCRHSVRESRMIAGSGKKWSQICSKVNRDVGNRYSSEDKQGTCSHGAHILRYTLAYISIGSDIILSKLIKSTRMKTDLCT